MLKLFLAFVAFAAVALFILSRGGDIDMSGEKHGIESHGPDHAASAPAAAASTGSAPAPTPAASASK